MGYRKVIARGYLPTRLPIFSTAVVWMLLDRFDVKGWELGVIWTVWTILVVAAIAAFFYEEQVPPSQVEK